MENSMNTRFLLSPEQLAQWREDGYLLVSGLFAESEIVQMREHFMQMQRDALNLASPLRDFYRPLSVEESNGDVLKQFPRVIHPHRFDADSMRWMLDERIASVLQQFWSEPALAAQSMFYFKPPGARGQALHQDNFYLNVRPGTCCAAWVAVDDADPENGGMSVVPGSQTGGVRCPHLADMNASFTTEEVGVPSGLQAVPAVMKAGDVLFFGGEMIHGSTPNSSQERFRRAFICHYVPASTTAMNRGYLPLRHFDGTIAAGVEALEGPLNTCGAEEWATFQQLRSQWMKDHAAAVAIH